MQDRHAGSRSPKRNALASSRFALRRIVDRSWVIVHAKAPEYAVRPLAHIRVTDDDIAEVTWAERVPLPVIYATPQDALESLVRWERGRHGATKPVPIAHFPPPGPRPAVR